MRVIPNLDMRLAKRLRQRKDACEQICLSEVAGTHGVAVSFFGISLRAEKARVTHYMVRDRRKADCWWLGEA